MKPAKNCFHMPDDARQKFQAIVEEGLADNPSEELARLCLALRDCTDILPRGACDMLDIPQGSSYADAARHLIR